MTPKRRRRLLALLSVLFGALLSCAPTLARAASESVDSWTISYRVQPSGDVDVTETLVYRFGTSSGRHGIERSFIVREAWDHNTDAVYTISAISADGPDAASEFSTRTTQEGRNEYLTLRIGSPTRVITTPTATYTLNYQVSGAIRTFDDYDEFYWDAISGETPPVHNIEVTAQVPGGVQEVTCYSGPAQQNLPCTEAVVSRQSASGQPEGVYRQSVKNSGEILTIGARITSGLVTDNTPHLVSRADSEEVALRRFALAAGALNLLVAPPLGWWYLRRKGRDLRYVGLPPGVKPSPGENVASAPSPAIEVPVAFAPPEISVAEAGLLADGVLDTRETTATLVELAVRGAVQLRSEPGDARVRLVDPERASAPHEAILLNRLFADRDGEIELSHGHALQDAHIALTQSVQHQVGRNKWFTDVPSVGRRTGWSAGGMFTIFALTAVFGAGSQLLLLVLVFLPAIITLMVVRSKLQRGQRTGLGRALTDQVEGFRLYLATAEADQLRFEEGEDIFSRYLPWAIIFGLTDRWAKLCADLVRQGRLSAQPPYWYYGNYDAWNFFVLNNALSDITTSAQPAPPPSAGPSGSGFGGGSSFGSGGGFSGGGGGGGGVGSW